MYLCKKIIVMTRIVTSSEFKANQAHFFDMANKGERIILKSRLKGNFLLVPMNDEPTKMGEEQSSRGQPLFGFRTLHWRGVSPLSLPGC